MLPFPRCYPGYAADVWSLGCLLTEVLTGEMLFIDKMWSELYVHLCTAAAVGAPSAPVTTRSTLNTARSAGFGKYLRWVEEEEQAAAEGAPFKASSKPRLQLSLPLLRKMYTLVEGGSEGFFADYPEGPEGGAGAGVAEGEEGEAVPVAAPAKEAVHTLIEAVLNGSLQRLPQRRMPLSSLVATLASFFATPSCSLAQLGVVK